MKYVNRWGWSADSILPSRPTWSLTAAQKRCSWREEASEGETAHILRTDIPGSCNQTTIAVLQARPLVECSVCVCEGLAYSTVIHWRVPKRETSLALPQTQAFCSGFWLAAFEKNRRVILQSSEKRSGTETLGLRLTLASCTNFHGRGLTRKTGRKPGLLGKPPFPFFTQNTNPDIQGKSWPYFSNQAYF